MPTLFPHQREGAAFLASRSAALLADEQRVGKTAAAITACDYVIARKILVVTKASARANWGREFREWGLPRDIQVVYSGREKLRPEADVVVVGWGMFYDDRLLKQLAARSWDALVLDESHEAKNPTAKRTLAAYKGGIKAAHVWCLSGTPIPNAPNDLYPMLSALWPTDFPESYYQFMHRYCVVRRKNVAGRWIEYAIKGRNEEELRARLQGKWLRRTQQHVGITRPIFSVFALHGGDFGKKELAALEEDLQCEAGIILEALETGSSISDMHLARIRSVTGLIKAYAVAEAAKEALDDGLDKLVLMAWHSGVIDVLKERLSEYGVVGIDGRTPPTQRDPQAQQFQNDPATRVFVGQIQAAGEAIDLSASAELWFVESSFTPKDMAQAAMRITNHTQRRQALVRVCALEGSIDEALMTILTRKVSTIKQIMEN